MAGAFAAAGSLLDATPALASGSEVEINVADYGALGTSDDSATFQAALDAVPPGGAQVVAPYGSYNVTNLSIASATHIWFPGVTLVNLANVTTPCLDVGPSASQVVVDGVQIDGADASPGSCGVVVAGSYCRITNVFVHDTSSHGIVIQGDGANPATHITVDACRVYNAGGSGITLVSSGGESAPTHVLVDANHVKGSKEAALGIEGVGMQVVFSNNVVENGLAAGEGGAGCAAYSHLNSNILCIGNSYAGMTLQGIHLGGSHIAAVGNTISSPGRTGILIESDEPETTNTDLDVSSNVITAAGTAAAPFSGVYVERMSGGAIAANMLDGASAHGVRTFRCDTLGITGNTIRDPLLGSCVRVDECQRVTISGNVGYGASQGYGVLVTSSTSTGITVAGNVLSTNGAGGVAARSEARQMAVSGNSILTAGVGSAITLSGAENTTAANYTDTSAVIPAASRLSLPRDVTVATVTGTATISELDTAEAEVGRVLYLRFAEGGAVAGGPNLILASPFIAPANSVLSLVCDGTTWYETSRSIN
ncbi:MAG TPA: right-handed parallel beta-helix repeat-containing protein [Solirubrobacteraceae bacterium]|nr:right-handed parallel beta-helix repeat-containing protein [Solirubrobacteraceae bacterium]